MRKNVDFIISLIGTNPTPSYFTILKNCSEDSRVYLVYSDKSKNSISTAQVAKNIADVVEKKYKNLNVNLIECDKSDTKQIDGVISKILKEIRNEIKLNPYEDRNIVLDYSSGTKAMSALFYDRFKEFEEESTQVINSYLDDITGKFIDGSSESIKDIIENNKLDIEDITKIHGYKLINRNDCQIQKSNSKISNHAIYNLTAKNKVQFSNNKGNIIYIDSVYMFCGKIYIYSQSKYTKSEDIKNYKSKVKMEMFELKDKAEKIAGSRSGMIFRCYADDEIIKQLRKDLKSAYEYDMEKRLKIIKQEQIIEDELSISQC